MSAPQGLYNETSDAVLDAISINGTTFEWNGGGYDCVLNAAASTLTTHKSQFGNRSYPVRGNTIRVQGKNMQVIAIDNSTSAFVDGGIIDVSNAFIDDPTDAGLLIAFRPFINK